MAFRGRNRDRREGHSRTKNGHLSATLDGLVESSLHGQRLFAGKPLFGVQDSRRDRRVAIEASGVLLGGQADADGLTGVVDGRQADRGAGNGVGAGHVNQVASGPELLELAKHSIFEGAKLTKADHRDDVGMNNLNRGRLALWPDLFNQAVGVASKQPGAHDLATPVGSREGDLVRRVNKKRRIFDASAKARRVFTVGVPRQRGHDVGQEIDAGPDGVKAHGRVSVDRGA